MKVSKKDFKTITKVIDNWHEQNLLSNNLSVKLKNTIEVKDFDYQEFSKLSFLVAFICIIITVFAALADKMILQIIEKIFHASYLKKFISLTVVTIITYLWGWQYNKKHPENKLSTEFIYLVAMLGNAGSLIMLNKTLFPYYGNAAHELMLFSAFEFGIIAILLHSNKIWCIALLIFGSWLGSATFYSSDAYYFTMNEPIKFIYYGLVLIVLSYLMQKEIKISFLSYTTLIMGLLNLFMALWVLSLSRYFPSPAENFKAIIWSLVFGITSLSSCFHGLKFENSTTWKFGVTFLLINLYTKFFEYFWAPLHKALFFAILAFSFWMLGKWSEKIFIKPRLQI